MLLSCAASFTQPEPIVQVQINGESRDFTGKSLRLSELVEQLSLAPQRIAIELNQQIVRRTDWELTEVGDGDKVEIVHFVGGGNAGGKRGRQTAEKDFSQLSVVRRTGVKSW
jgi:sulfur carrier protein